MSTAEERTRDWERAVARGGDDLREWWGLYGWRWTGPILYIDVEGNPAGQGALTPIRITPKGKKPRLGNRHSNEKKLLPWREAIREAAERAATRQKWQPVPKGTPVRLDSVYTLPYGPTLKKEGRLHPTIGSATNSDLDHYIRAAGDAVSTAVKPQVDTIDTNIDRLREAVEAALTAGLPAVWADDVQIVEHRAVKTYPTDCPGAHPLALPVPGARLWIHTQLDPRGDTR